MNQNNLTKGFAAILRDNNTLKIQATATDWKDAVQQVVELLVDARIALPSYADAIIKATEELGPYYLVADNVAMPHAVTGDYNLENGFSMLILKEPVDFGGQPVQVLICLSAISHDFHVAVALPQIAALFDDLDMGYKLSECTSVDQVYHLIDNIDFSKYLS